MPLGKPPSRETLQENIFMHLYENVVEKKRKYVFPELFPLFKGPGRAHTGQYGPIWFDFWSNFAHLGSKTCFLRWFHIRSVSFFGQETYEHVKTIKKCCLETQNDIFRKNAFKHRCVFLGGFPPGGAETQRRVFCLDCFGMFRHFGNIQNFLEYFDLFRNV